MPEFPQVPIKNYKELRREIRSGDILLCSGSSVFSTLIQKATKSVWSHVAFILRLDFIDRIMVLESVESIGVRTVPLSSYIYDYNATGKSYPGCLMLARHEDIKQERIANLSRSAVDLLGYPYDTEEIVRIATRISLYSIGLPTPLTEQPQREFICSEYAYACFKSIDITINYNEMGFIAPADFARDQKVKPICYLFTPAISSNANATPVQS